mmetsp:Transcript_21488/g.32649  ORF Transcript_21488/g.32649 Transcript_21488/m.32649 type:complete len:482 (-) Transcript_21488:45-1490(-)
MKAPNLHLAVIISTILATSPTQSAAIKCGIKGVTKPCIRDADNMDRYSANVSYNLTEQNSFWKSLEGLYVQDMNFFFEDGTPETNYTAGLPEGLGTFDMSKAKAFVNITVDGSRFYYHRYVMAKHNSDGPEDMQLPGLVHPFDLYAASTFEKNGEAKSMGIIQGYGNELKLVSAGENPATLNPIDDEIFLIVVPATNIDTTNHPVADRSYEVYDCTDPDCNKFKTYNEGYIGLLQDEESTPPHHIRYSRTSSTKVDIDTWMEEFNNVFTEFSIPPPNDPLLVTLTNPNINFNFNIPTFTQPFDPSKSESTPACFTLACPTEDDWKLADPYLGTSPYIEPDGLLAGGFIAGVTTACIVSALLLFFTIYKRGVMARENRVKEVVLISLATTMSLKITQTLSVEDLQEMFEKIDIDGNGSLDKDEMKGLVEEAGVKNMSDRDYDLLFASIDLDGNGTLDFVEFCAFFASISIDESSKDTFEEDA